MIELLKILIGIALGCFRAWTLTLFWLWTLTLFWLWYVATPFHLRPITFIEAMGLGLIVQLFTLQIDTTVKRDEYDFAKALATSVGIYLSAWLAAGLIHVLSKALA